MAIVGLALIAAAVVGSASQVAIAFWAVEPSTEQYFGSLGAFAAAAVVGVMLIRRSDKRETAAAEIARLSIDRLTEKLDEEREQNATLQAMNGELRARLDAAETRLVERDERYAQLERVVAELRGTQRRTPRSAS